MAMLMPLFLGLFLMFILYFIAQDQPQTEEVENIDEVSHLGSNISSFVKNFKSTTNNMYKVSGKFSKKMTVADE